MKIRVEHFRSIPAVPCGKHDNIAKGQRGVYSCGCGIADAGCYVIVKCDPWGGQQGLGFVCENKEDGDRAALMMNTAYQMGWDKAISAKEEN